MTDSPTVFIVDDDQAVRDSLKFLVESNGVSGKTYASAQDFLDDYAADWCGCLLLDVRMPEINGFELQKEMHKRQITLPVIFISAHGTIPAAVRALKSGAVDFVMKPFNNVDLLEKIDQAIEADKRQREQQSQSQLINQRIANLTRREHEIMRLIVEGKPAKKIADQLGISNKTVDVHRSHIMEKLEIKSVAELVKMVLSMEDHNR